VNYSIPPCLHSHLTLALFIYAHGKITFSSPPSCCEIFWYTHIAHSDTRIFSNAMLFSFGRVKAILLNTGQQGLVPVTHLEKYWNHNMAVFTCKSNAEHISYTRL
jgi:hypothetical protein